MNSPSPGRATAPLRLLLVCMLLAFAACFAGASPALAAGDAPQCFGQDYGSVDNESTVWIGLYCYDTEGDPLTYSIVDQPDQGGTLTGPTDRGGTVYVDYKAKAGFNGTETFTFKANDGTSDSAPATMTIRPHTPFAPSCTSPTAATKVRPGRGVSIGLSGACMQDGNFSLPKSYTVSKQPAHGTLTVEPNYGSAYYVADPGYTGPDSFTWTGSNAGGSSGDITQTIDVDPNYNQAPQCWGNPGQVIRVNAKMQMGLPCWDYD